MVILGSFHQQLYIVNKCFGYSSIARYLVQPRLCTWKREGKAQGFLLLIDAIPLHEGLQRLGYMVKQLKDGACHDI